MRIPLVSGAYQARSVIASAQRCVNLFPESNLGDPQAPVPVTHYPTPGLDLFSTSDQVRAVRCMYRSTAGKLYAVIGPDVFYIDNEGVQTLLGSIFDQNSICTMADNGLAIVLVDGTSNGYAINMSNNDFGNIIDPNFYGANFVVFLDTYFVFNRPNTNQFYISLSLVDYTLLTAGTSFDPLDIAAKISSADNIVGIQAKHDELWLIGVLTTEVWKNIGAADFTFQKVQGAFIEHGCAAQYSIAAQDVSVFWLSQDREGQAIIVRGAEYAIERISTHAIEADIESYAIISDAVGYCYQQQGHSFYVLSFNQAQKTWVYELATKQWHEWNWIDTNGQLKRHRGNCHAFAYRQNLVGDWQNGKIYIVNPSTYTDDGNPIPRIRTYPHLISNGQRVSYRQFIVDIQTGTLENSNISAPDFNNDFNNDFGPPLVIYDPLLTLRWSDDRGASYGNPITMSMGKIGEYLKQLSFWRLGMARDRVFEISWSVPARTALNGAFVEFVPSRS